MTLVNDINYKCKYVFYVPSENLARKGLTLDKHGWTELRRQQEKIG